LAFKEDIGAYRRESREGESFILLFLSGPALNAEALMESIGGRQRYKRKRVDRRILRIDFTPIHVLFSVLRHPTIMLSTSLFTLATLALTATASPLQKRDNYGRATFYDVGLGNCGGYNSANEHVVALNTAQYGSTSQVSSACGQTITITYNGKTEQATIVDSCPTCPNQALDMSTSLFSALTGGNMGLGQIYVNWSWGSGSSSSSSSSSSKSSSSKSNSNKSSNNNSNKSSSSSSSSSSSTPTSTSSASPSTQTLTTSLAPNNTATKLVSGVPQWWKTIGNGACPDVIVPDGADAVAVGPSGNAELDTLPAACGKWVQVWNTATNQTTKAILSDYITDASRGSIYMADAYLKIANMTGTVPNVITNATWGFLN